ncbi:MAG TPA: hypothetical protein VK957_12205 [Lunatimonas sp.]|nr:hypothetical protein [Lunatimonas sp.]
MKTLPTQLPIILHYLNLESGNKKVIGSLEKTYDWLKYKLARTTFPDQLKELQDNPGDPEVQDQWRMILEEAVAEDDLLFEELDVRLREAVAFIQDNDPEWYQAHSANQLSSKMPTNKTKSEDEENLVG